MSKNIYPAITLPHRHKNTKMITEVACENRSYTVSFQWRLRVSSGPSELYHPNGRYGCKADVKTVGNSRF